MKIKQGERYLEFSFNENELIRYVIDCKAKCENGEIETDEDISEFVMSN